MTSIFVCVRWHGVVASPFTERRAEKGKKTFCVPSDWQLYADMLELLADIGVERWRERVFCVAALSFRSLMISDAGATKRYQ